MKSIAIYMEGGGQSADGRDRLRHGMGEFLGALRDLARVRGLRWKIVACGSRNNAFEAFQHEVASSPATFNVLLVDSEETLASAARAHLEKRDSWSFSGVSDDQIHLMVTTMETWIAADPDALAKYYGQDFNAKVLPKRSDLETVDKAAIASALAQATRKTKKGQYHKIDHAGTLLELIDAAKVQRRCPHCERLFTSIQAKMGGA